MNRKCLLSLLLVLVCVMLTACGGNEEVYFPEMTQNLGPATMAPTAPPAMPQNDAMQDSPMPENGGESIFEANPYDIPDEFTEQDVANEENIDPFADQSGDLFAAEPEGTFYPYAGSSPIPLNPVDMPTPTPHAPLSFTFTPYTASIGVTFEGPVGWMVDESQPQIFVLSEPDNMVNDGQACILTISAEPVTSNYDERDLATQVKQRLDTLSSEYKEWNRSELADRHMLGGKGKYANYSAVNVAGYEVGGRIQYVCVDRVLYGLEIIYPRGFKNDYMEVFHKAREMKLVK